MSAYRAIALVLVFLACMCGTYDGIQSVIGEPVDHGPAHTLFLAAIAYALLAQGEGKR